MTLLERIEAHLNDHVAVFGGDKFSKTLLKEAADRIRVLESALHDIVATQYHKAEHSCGTGPKLEYFEARKLAEHALNGAFKE